SKPSDNLIVKVPHRIHLRRRLWPLATTRSRPLRAVWRISKLDLLEAVLRTERACASDAAARAANGSNPQIFMLQIRLRQQLIRGTAPHSLAALDDGVAVADAGEVVDV